MFNVIYLTINLTKQLQQRKPIGILNILNTLPFTKTCLSSKNNMKLKQQNTLTETKIDLS